METRPEITEPKQDETALRQNQDRFRALVAASSDAMYRMSADWSEMRQLRGGNFIARAAGPSRTWLQDYIHPDDRARLLAVAQEAIRTKSIFELEHRVLRADGSLGWTFSRAVPLLDANGEIMEWFGAASDITERKRAEEALRASQAKYEGIINSAMDAVISVDEQQHIVVFNRAAEIMFKCAAAEAMGSALDRFLPKSLREIHRDHIRRFGNEAAPPRPMSVPGTLTAIRSSGEEFPIESMISQVHTGGEVLYTVILRDITDRKLAELALIRSEKLASVGRMAATIAHEINNPLASAINALYLARTDPALPEGVKRYISLAEQELARVSHITKQTLGFYKEVGTTTTIDVPSVLDSLLDLYRPRLKNKSISVRRSYRSDTAIRAVEGELRQIASNIIANAIDALPEGGNLYVRLSSPQVLHGERRMVRVTIADNGEGIAPENLKHIFEPFFTTKKSVGTGLGLWVTSELVKKHEGRLRIRSKLGKGTVLIVWLPVDRRGQERRTA
jgi:PAS domain S-box-containing protein